MDSAASPDFVQRAIKDAGVKLILVTANRWSAGRATVHGH